MFNSRLPKFRLRGWWSVRTLRRSAGGRERPSEVTSEPKSRQKKKTGLTAGFDKGESRAGSTKRMNIGVLALSVYRRAGNILHPWKCMNRGHKPNLHSLVGTIFIEFFPLLLPFQNLRGSDKTEKPENYQI
jgi:hypothetical protein